MRYPLGGARLRPSSLRTAHTEARPPNGIPGLVSSRQVEAPAGPAFHRTAFGRSCRRRRQPCPGLRHRRHQRSASQSAWPVGRFTLGSLSVGHTQPHPTPETAARSPAPVGAGQSDPSPRRDPMPRTAGSSGRSLAQADRCPPWAPRGYACHNSCTPSASIASRERRSLPVRAHASEMHPARCNSDTWDT
jgi:hypothetical protein